MDILLVFKLRFNLSHDIPLDNNMWSIESNMLIAVNHELQGGGGLGLGLGVGGLGLGWGGVVVVVVVVVVVGGGGGGGPGDQAVKCFLAKSVFSDINRGRPGGDFENYAEPTAYYLCFDIILIMNPTLNNQNY